MSNPLMRHPLWTLHDIRERIHSKIEITSPEAHIERADHIEDRRVRNGVTSVGAVGLIGAVELVFGIDPEIIEWSTFGAGVLAGSRVFGNFQWAAYHRAKAEQLRQHQAADL
jgi:hypothetical protein